MFFYLSKFVWELISPLNFILALLLLGTLLRLVRWRRTGTAILALAAIIFVAIGVLPVGPDLLAKLETRYPPPAMLPKQITGIVILGGALETGLSAAHGYPVMGPNGQRLLEGIRLAQLYPHARVVFTGGENALIQGGQSEALDVQAFVQRYGLLPEKRIIYESASRNTAENFVLTRNIVHPKTGETWILVTSAFHMPRAMASAQAAGWPAMIPWPANYMADDDMRWLPRGLHDANLTMHFQMADIALHEYAGLLAYRLFRPENGSPR